MSCSNVNKSYCHSKKRSLLSLAQNGHGAGGRQAAAVAHISVEMEASVDFLNDQDTENHEPSERRKFDEQVNREETAI